MTKVLITGGTGILGAELVSQLQANAYSVRIMSRCARPTGLHSESEWAQADMETGQGLQQAVTAIDVIIHAASNPLKNTWAVDVEGTQRLLEAAHLASVSHIVYISIVGIERVPYAYYQAKVATEAVLKAGAVPYTILRTTQFHDFIGLLCQSFSKLPLFAFYPSGFSTQPIATDEVAARLVACVAEAPAGLLPDMGGPEVHSARDIMRSWLAARGTRRILVPLWMPGKAGQGFRKGYNTCPDHRQGKITWAQWLNQNYALKNQYMKRFAAPESR